MAQTPSASTYDLVDTYTEEPTASNRVGNYLVITAYASADITSDRHLQLTLPSYEGSPNPRVGAGWPNATGV